MASSKRRGGDRTAPGLRLGDGGGRRSRIPRLRLHAAMGADRRDGGAGRPVAHRTVGDQAAGVGMSRGQLVPALVVAALAVGGAVFADRDVGPDVVDAAPVWYSAFGERCC